MRIFDILEMLNVAVDVGRYINISMILNILIFVSYQDSDGKKVKATLQVKYEKLTIRPLLLR